MEKRRKFTCYFCNKTIENDTELGHTSVCGSVLVPCPHKCGSYVRRIDLQNHRKDCVNRLERTNHVETYLPSSSTLSLERNRRNGQNKELKDIFLKMQDDLNNISDKLSFYEQRNFNQSPNKSGDELKQFQRIFSQDLDRVKYQNNFLLEWKRKLDIKLAEFQGNLSVLENFRNNNNLEKIPTIIDNLRKELEDYKSLFLTEQNYNRQNDFELYKKIEDLKDLTEKQIETLKNVYNDQKIAIEEFHKEISDIKQGLHDQKNKISSIVYDVKTISQISSEAGEICQIQKRELGDIRGQIEQIQFDMDILDGLVGGESSIASNSGHIIWRISDFDNKMTKSKDSNTVLKSPLFYTHKFGYKIRVLLYLNGLKKWKDRYALLSLHVLKGDHDALLRWPCHLEGTVILRDLEDLDNPKNVSKYISAKRETGGEESEEPQESSSSYIFIPHSVLTKSKYLRDDEIYLEVKVEKRKKSETTL